MDESPPDWARYLFWLIAGCLSVCFAEIVAGQSDFPFFNFEGLFIVLPLYALHTLVLAFIVYRFGTARLYTLYLAGTIFGLYEAYVTKIIWSPPWGPAIWTFHGVAVVETLLLVLFWHPVMSFTVALFASESILTRSREILSGLPGPLKAVFQNRRSTYAAILGFALLCGLYQGTKVPTSAEAFLSAITAGAILVLLIFAYRRMGLHRFAIRQMLPSRREFLALLVLLLAMYAVFAVSLRPEAIPGTVPQAIVLTLYAVFFGLLYLSLHKSGATVLRKADFKARFSLEVFALFFVLFGASSALMCLVPARATVQLAFWYAAIAVGVILLLFSVIDLLRRPGPSAH